MTVAYYLAYNKIIPPQQWQHDPNLQLGNKKNTVAMMLAIHGNMPPKEWEHKPEL